MKVKAIKTFTTGRAHRATPNEVLTVPDLDAALLLKRGLVVELKEEKAVRKTKEQK